MERLIVLAAVLALVSLLAVFWAAQFLERELRRQCAKAEERQAELGGTIRGLSSVLAALRRNLTEMEAKRKEDAAAMEAQRKKDMETLLTELETAAGAFRMVFEKMEEMPSRQDLEKHLKRLEAMLEDSPAGLGPEREAAMSKAMEEGIASILAYTSGKAPGVELRL